MPTKSTIKPICDHLAWLEHALRDPDTPETPYRKALLALNAATLLDWHFTLSSPTSRKQPAESSARKKLEKLIAEYTKATREGVSKTERLTGSNAERPLGTLADATAGFLKKSTTIWKIKVTPRREREFEKPLRPAKLISESLAGNDRKTAGGKTKAKAVSPRIPDSPEELARVECVYAMAPAWAAQQLFDDGKLPADGYAAARKVSATFLEAALEAVNESSETVAERKKWVVLGTPVVKSLRRPAQARTGKAGA